MTDTFHETQAEVFPPPRPNTLTAVALFIGGAFVEVFEEQKAKNRPISPNDATRKANRVVQQSGANNLVVEVWNYHAFCRDDPRAREYVEGLIAGLALHGRPADWALKNTPRCPDFEETSSSKELSVPTHLPKTEIMRDAVENYYSSLRARALTTSNRKQPELLFEKQQMDIVTLAHNMYIEHKEREVQQVKDTAEAWKFAAESERAARELAEKSNTNGSNGSGGNGRALKKKDE